MSINWPPSLIPEIAERRCIMFLGAGASAGCQARVGGAYPPDWPKLLTRARDLVRDTAERKLIDGLVSKERFLDAAEIIIARSNSADYTAFIRHEFVDPQFQHAAIHEEVLKLDSKVVITTNYDDVYETYCKSGKGSQGYNVCRYYENHALNDVRSTTRLILKAHGCISNPQRTILSRTQYHNAQKDYPQFFNLLDALFMANTVLFIGCSLSDPDFQLLLENTNIKHPSAHPHYAVLASGQPEPLRLALRTVYNVQSLEYTAGQYHEVVDGLKALNGEVQNWRTTHP